MRLSRYHLPTIKEAPKDAELISHRYLIRGGFIRMLAAGIYDFLPLGVRVLQKVTRVVREEMNRAGGMEVLLPAVQPSELWKESGRWQYYGPELLRFTDRHGREFCYGPTHEEVITDLVRRDIRSYRDLPINLYQIQTKFRDEVKPRGGLIRGREFIMKDAYSFDADEAGAKASYQAMYQAYTNIFRRCGLDFRVVEADTGNIGGSMSHEFQVVAATGEDYVLKCTGCDFTVNRELAPLPRPAGEHRADEGTPPLERVHTPDQKSVEEVAQFLEVTPRQVIKTLICMVDGEPVGVLLRGDHELSDVKLRRALAAGSVELADDDTVSRVSSAIVGFAGPVGLKCRLVADYSVLGMHDAVIGANQDYHHYRHAEPGRDFAVESWLDVREAQDGDPCPQCEGGRYSLFRGIEVGHIFYLGTKYSKAMNCTFLDVDGRPVPAIMGCYGIGVTRIISAAIEQNHDENGICWPAPIAPFEAVVIPIQHKDEGLMQESEALYERLVENGVEAVLDDRPERPGVKFNDADLVGFPYQIVMGRRDLDAGVAEVKTRCTGERRRVPLGEVVSLLAGELRSA